MSGMPYRLPARSSDDSQDRFSVIQLAERQPRARASLQVSSRPSHHEPLDGCALPGEEVVAYRTIDGVPNSFGNNFCSSDWQLHGANSIRASERRAQPGTFLAVTGMQRALLPASSYACRTPLGDLPLDLGILVPSLRLPECLRAGMGSADLDDKESLVFVSSVDFSGCLIANRCVCMIPTLSAY